MKLYDFAFSPNCRKVRAVAYELGIELEYAFVDLIRGEQRSAPYLAKNPNGRVPLLDDDGFLLWESTAILRYLAAMRGGSLLPSTAREQAEVDRWLAWQVGHLSPAMSKVSFERVVKRLTGRGTPDQARIDEGSAEFAALSGVLDASLGDKEYVAGRLSIADFAVAAHYSLAPMAGLDVTPALHPRVHAWLGRMLARSSMKRALDDAQATMSHAR